MNSDVIQISPQVQYNVRTYDRYCAQHEFTAALMDVIYELNVDRKRQYDVIDQLNKEITDLTNKLAIYTNANSPSGKDPKGYEDAKEFLAKAEVYEEARGDNGDSKMPQDVDKDDNVAKEDRDPTKAVQAKLCGGQSGHPGKSHHAKSEYTIMHTAEICDECGRTDLELLKPINKITTDCGESGKAGEDTKHVYTARVTFGWCDKCMHVVDSAPHLVWGTWMSGKALAATVQYKSNPLGRLPIAENLEELHNYVVSPAAVSNSITAYSKSLEERVLPDSVVTFVKAKRDASARQDNEIFGDVKTTAQAEPAGPVELIEQTTQPASPAHPTVSATTAPKPKTKKEREAEKRNVPYTQTPQGITDTRLTSSTTSYPGSWNMSFIELCRE